MDTVITAGVLLAMTVMGALLIHTMHLRQAERSAVFHYSRFQPKEDLSAGAGYEGRDRRSPARPLPARTHSGHRASGRVLHPARRRRTRRQ